MDGPSNDPPPSNSSGPSQPTNAASTLSESWPQCPAMWLGLIEEEMNNDHPMRNSTIYFEPSEVNELQAWITTWKFRSKGHAKETLWAIIGKVFRPSRDFARDIDVGFDCLAPTLGLLSCVGESLVRLYHSIDQAGTMVAYLKDSLDFMRELGRCRFGLGLTKSVKSLGQRHEQFARCY